VPPGGGVESRAFVYSRASRSITSLCIVTSGRPCCTATCAVARAAEAQRRRALPLTLLDGDDSAPHSCRYGSACAFRNTGCGVCPDGTLRASFTLPLLPSPMRVAVRGVTGRGVARAPPGVVSAAISGSVSSAGCRIPRRHRNPFPRRSSRVRSLNRTTLDSVAERRAIEIRASAAARRALPEQASAAPPRRHSLRTLPTRAAASLIDMANHLHSH
jgi:hypothetical protein